MSDISLMEDRWYKKKAGWSGKLIRTKRDKDKQLARERLNFVTLVADFGP